MSKKLHSPNKAIFYEKSDHLRKPTGTGDGRTRDNDHSTAGRRPPCSCRTSHGSQTWRGADTPADPGTSVSLPAANSRAAPLVAGSPGSSKKNTGD